MSRTLLTLPLTTAISQATAGPSFQFQQQSGQAPTRLTVQFALTWGSGGTSVDCYLQTSLDGGTSWVDIANFHGTMSSLISIANFNAQTVVALFSPTDASIASNTVKDGIPGSHLRCKYKSSGTYASTTLIVTVDSDRLAHPIRDAGSQGASTGVC
jgi:hypothetical protein